jgi:hypothetical protein
LDPKLSKIPWSKKEDTQLMRLVRKHNSNWTKIAREMDQRSDVQCRHRYQQIQGPDEMSCFTIRALVDIGLTLLPDDLKSVSEHELVSVPDIFERFITGHISSDEAKVEMERLIGTSEPLDRLEELFQTPLRTTAPSRRKGNKNSNRHWTLYEEHRMIAGIHNLGNMKWNEIAEFVGNGRSGIGCHIRWRMHLDPKISKMQWSKDEDDRLMELVSEYGHQDSWNQIASRMETHNQYQCRFRYQQIQHTQAAAVAGYAAPSRYRPRCARLKN